MERHVRNCHGLPSSPGRGIWQGPGAPGAVRRWEQGHEPTNYVYFSDPFVPSFIVYS